MIFSPRRYERIFLGTRDSGEIALFQALEKERKANLGESKSILPAVKLLLTEPLLDFKKADRFPGDVISQHNDFNFGIAKRAAPGSGSGTPKN
jgi:hypothetical protein